MALPLAVVLSALPASAQEAPSKASVGEGVAQGFARPALSRLADAAASTAGAVRAMCATPSPQARERVGAAFGELAGTWGRALVLRFGPLARDNRFERMFFWPDPRGIALRQVQALLVEEPDTAETVEGLAAASVAVQGIPALEFALFGTGSETLGTPDGAWRCLYAHAVAGNVAAIAADVRDEWETSASFGAAFEDPDPSHDLYRTEAEVDGEIVKAMATALQFTVAAELAPPLGEDAAKANGRRAPLWRSETTFELAGATVAAVEALMDAADYAARLPRDQRFLVDSIRFELHTAGRAVEAVDLPPEAAFRDATERGRINLAVLALDHARDLLSENMPAALGLTMGFNALDGD